MENIKHKNIVKLYDALVMVHPDFGDPINPNYEQNLQDIIEAFKLMNKPVFVMEPIATEKMRKYLKDAITIPLDYTSETRLDGYQKDIDFIAKHVGKSPKDIKLAFGGIYAHACVYFYATSWCEVVEINHSGECKFTRSTNPIKYGKILEEIV